MATVAGRMQGAATISGEERWNPDHVFARFPERWTVVGTAARIHGFPEPEPASADAMAVAAALDDPAWQTFAHTDLTPNNVMIAGGSAVVIDFEGAGRRHCMVDGAMFSLSFPQYGLWAALPKPVVENMERAYRSGLAAGLPQALDDDAFGGALATGCAAWTLVRLARLDAIADPGQPPVEALRRRSQIVHTIESGLRVLATTGAYPALHAWLGEVAGEMRHRWAEARDEPRSFPAFSGADHALA